MTSLRDDLPKSRIVPIKLCCRLSLEWPGLKVILMNTYNKGFNGVLIKIIFHSSSNTPLICSSDGVVHLLDMSGISKYSKVWECLS